MNVTAKTFSLEARALRAGYQDVEVLHAVDLDVAAGEIVALLGPNGAGKSTLLLALSGYIKPMDGEVRLFGHPCTEAPHRRARRGVAFLGEERHVFPSLTVSQTLRLVPDGRTSAVEMFPRLGELLRRRVGLLSGGEQKMLMLGQALAGKPSVLLMDELSLGLAPLVRDELLAILRRVADAGTAVIVVEQSVRSVLGVADRAYVLRRGEIVDHRPARQWVRDLETLVRLFLS